MADEDLQEQFEDAAVETVEPTDQPLPQPEPPEPPEPDQPEISQEEIQQLIALRDQLSQDPRQVAAALAEQYLPDLVQAARQAQQAAQPQPPQPRPLTDEDLFDPNRMQEFINQQVQLGINQVVQPIQAQLDYRLAAEANSYAAYATQQFASRYGLNQSDADEIANRAAQILHVTAQGKDGITACTEALEQTAWALPEFRDHVARFQAEQQKEANKRQRKLAMVGGTTGSVPRTQPQPTTSHGRLVAMAEEIAAHQGHSDWTPDR